jgi:hypothetical protein
MSALSKLIRPLAVGLAAAALLLYGRCDGSKNAEQRILARIADSVSVAAKAHADSVEYARKMDAINDSIASLAARARERARLDSVIADSRRAQASAATAALNARQLLALESATTTQLRASLAETADAVDTLNKTIDRERAAHTLALARQDTSYQKQIARLNLGFTRSMAARDTSDQKRATAFSTALTQAHGSGVRSGRLQGAGAVLALVLGVAAIIR